MNRRVGIGVIVFLAATRVSAQDLLDPKMRDEDISAVQASVEVIQRGDGLYEYVYEVFSPASNKGTVTAFSIGLRCAEPFSPVDLPSPPAGADGSLGNNAEVPITPTAVTADHGGAALYGIDSGGDASFTFRLRPGESAAGLRLISPAAPGHRPFAVRPEWSTDPDVWAYPHEVDETIPWVTDFIVRGVITGPGCPGVTEPPEMPHSHDYRPQRR
jgi:hypothetical protein